MAGRRSPWQAEITVLSALSFLSKSVVALCVCVCRDQYGPSFKHKASVLERSYLLFFSSFFSFPPSFLFLLLFFSSSFSL